MVKLIALCLAITQIQVAISQCLNRQASNIVFNRQIPETIIETPINPFLQQTIIETPNMLPMLPQFVPPSPTTIITDCTPSVCKNLANTLQLMIVCNLLKNTKGGSDLAAQLASPIIGEVLSSGAFPCACPEKRFINPVPNVISPGFISPNTIPGLIGPTNMIPGSVFPNPGITSVNNNALLGNILGILSNQQCL